MKLQKPHLTLPKLPTWLLISVPAVIVLAALTYGIVRNEQAKQAENRALASQQAAEKAQEQASATATAQATAELTAATSKADTACSLLKQYSVAPATKKLVTIPAICQ